MDFYDLVTQRCSLRSFIKEQPVDQEVLRRILEAGRMAPSAKNLQPWTFKVVSSPEKLEQIYPSYPADWIRSAPHLLFVTGRKDEAWQRKYDGYNSIETDLTIALDHIILAATWEGLATCWIEAFNPAILRPALGLDDNEALFAFTPLGYPAPDAKPRPKSRKKLDEIVEFL
ncbi:nitroreductase family protein [Prosthecochloris sp. N3]|uniref:Nitroreductase family protein n=1 Tax=Prosthecochloris ethylica TaxID=2743976 RepID=A0ABR9XSN8_9CHLB|nr:MULTISPECIES: nitroreductase family protein [Prosthecochloris]MEC9486859.1 nitroreductase family protein [Prosthecochloris sp.]MBF0585933.1 nitroreductase family protein [Prosthecochloris ethylica]MBF0637062.1 nitroreductase family protein [Prosthecochloris ethylica]NUK47299.1 nitroreductase family protein [Prosthecochloris ethylica]RNA64091.1 nitroreductase [Prosthecochloris sp. ZM_2]